MNPYISDDGESWGYEEERDSRNDYLRAEQQEQPQPDTEEDTPQTLRED